jgi:hypothetical protein
VQLSCLVAFYSLVCLFHLSLSAIGYRPVPTFNSLLLEGFKRADIAAAIRESRRSRHVREHSYYNRSWDDFHERLEKTSRNLKKVVGLRKTLTPSRQSSGAKAAASGLGCF